MTEEGRTRILLANVSLVPTRTEFSREIQEGIPSIKAAPCATCKKKKGRFEASKD